MKQFDVCRLRDDRDHLVVILQHDVADDLSTRIVAPLSDKPFRNLIARARVKVKFQEEPFVLQLDRMAAIDRRTIGAVIGSVARHQYEIQGGLDLLFAGV